MADFSDTLRSDIVARKAEGWARELIDLGHRNKLLHFTPGAVASLDLTNCEPAVQAKLLSGGKIDLRSVFRSKEENEDAVRRVRSIHRKIRGLEEEQGIDAGRIAHGLVKTPRSARRNPSPPTPLRAPLLLRSISIRSRNAAQTEFQLESGSEPEVNRVLLHSLARDHGFEIDVDDHVAKFEAQLAELTEPQDQLRMVFADLHAIARSNGTELELDESLAIGLFSYEKLAMVEDLQSATSLLSSHDLVAALAGYEPAIETVREQQSTQGNVDLDEIPPSDEYLVRDTDSSQHDAILASLGGRNVLIEGPPGTGKSQTIANILAGAAAKGMRVLFVAEKRAAIEAVTARLAEADLNGLVLDLHRTRHGKRHLARQLAERLDDVTQEPQIDSTELHRTLVHRRRSLIAHTRELHEPRGPWGVTPFQVKCELMEIGSEYATRCAFRGVQLRRLDRPAAEAVGDDLEKFVSEGGLRILSQESPWWQADVRTTDDVRKVLEELDEVSAAELRRCGDDLRRLTESVGLPLPEDLGGRREALVLLDQVAESVNALGPELFGDDLDLLFHATAPQSVRANYPTSLPWLQRRALLKRVRSMSRSGVTKKRALHAQLERAVGERDRWRKLAGSTTTPSVASGLDEAMREYERLRAHLAAVATCVKLEDLENRPAAEIEASMEELHNDREMLFKLPALNTMRKRLTEFGLGELLRELVQREATPHSARMMFQHAWLSSLDDEFRIGSSTLAAFSGEQHTSVMADFKRTDTSHQRTAARRVRRRVASRSRQVRDEFPEEARLVQRESNKKTRHLPPRKLVEQAPNVLLSLHPCWAMSPLLVSQILPPQRLFDLVIFDEASQIRPHDAITSIMRGSRVVVAGDEKQLPPSTWFDRLLAEDDEPDDQVNIGTYESILTSLRAFLPHQHLLRLRWHYRSEDERLIAFSNKEIYENDLVTFPGTNTESPLRLEVVEGIATPGAKDSSTMEIQRVVDLVLDHATQRPTESLGVITLGDKHRERVEQAIRTALRDRKDFDAFFLDDGHTTQRFFVKSIETVQGDERDAIILSIGVAKRASGTVSRTSFGPLNSEGGQRRLNVAVSRARRRMTVVSSFSSGDLAPSDRVNGTELLRRFLDAAERGGDVESGGRVTNIRLNGFEQDILHRLSAQGINVFPQWGFSDFRIDFALAHPNHPGRMVLAVEADGDSYHRMRSARDRDRLRQEHLERLGWKFHRVWASAWFSDPERETRRIVAAWDAAVRTSTARDSGRDSSTHPPEPYSDRDMDGMRCRADLLVAKQRSHRGPRPDVPRGLTIAKYTDGDLHAICAWLIGDGLPMDRDARVAEAMRELGFRRRGKHIVDRLATAVDRAQRQADAEEE